MDKHTKFFPRIISNFFVRNISNWPLYSRRGIFCSFIIPYDENWCWITRNGIISQKLYPAVCVELLMLLQILNSRKSGEIVSHPFGNDCHNCVNFSLEEFCCCLRWENSTMTVSVAKSWSAITKTSCISRKCFPKKRTFDQGKQMREKLGGGDEKIIERGERRS